MREEQSLQTGLWVISDGEFGRESELVGSL